VVSSSDRPLGPSILYDYDLIAVVNHEGQMNTGHYTNFAKFRNDVSPFPCQYEMDMSNEESLSWKWYRFDDEK